MGENGIGRIGDVFRGFFFGFARTEKLRHFTDKKGAEGIARTGTIKASTDTKNDAKYGEGAYFVSSLEEPTKEGIIKQLYGPRASKRKSDRADYVVSVLEKDLPRKPRKVDPKHHIYVVDGKGFFSISLRLFQVKSI